MNKLIFQIGVLGFCVAAVVYGGSGGSILDILFRSFVVFVGIILAATMIVVVLGTMMERNRTKEQPEAGPGQSSSQQTNTKS